MPNMTQALSKPSSVQKNSADKALPDSSVKAPGQLKNRFEQMSGLSFQEVQIHYSSSRPAAVGAQAYAAGNHVYLGPGQERHLPHELGHVLQQKQGRVQPTMQLGDVRINCDAALEHEADMLGRQAMQGGYGRETTILSRESGAREVVQCHGFFSEKLGGMDAEHPENLIDEILSDLGITGEDAKKLKNMHINFNQMNDQNILASGSRNTYGYEPNTREATIEEFILAQLGLIKQHESEDVPLMQMGAVFNGIARMLARKLGDMGASDKVLEKIMQKIMQKNNENIPDAQDAEEENLLREKINAFAQGNPILMYLHSEINAHDASVMLLKQTRALGKEREEVFSLVQEQALIQIKAMRQLERQGKNVSAVNTRKLSIADPIGLYSKDFIGQALTEEEGWSPESAAGINKLYGKFISMPADTPMGKYQGNPTLEKARRHEEKSYQEPRSEDSGDEKELKGDLREDAKKGVRDCYDRERLEKPENGDAGYFTILDNIVNLLQEAPIVISRFASDLLARELSPQSADKTLKPGTPLSYISLEELIRAEKNIRRHRRRNGEGPEIAQKYTLARSGRSSDGDFPYTALLSEDSEEGKERGISYPVFRSNKNRLYAGKQQDAPQAVFGTFDLLGEHNYHGLDQGKKAGTYGDVVLVFRKNVFPNCMYTFGDRMRGYTQLKAFVYNAFAVLGNFAGRYRQELLVPENKECAWIRALLKSLIYLERGQKEKCSSLEGLEVQIFDTVRLNRDFISEVYFADSVPGAQRDAIKNAVAGTPATDGQADTMFYHYMENEHRVDPHLPMDYLYDKTSGEDARTKMTIEQVKQVLNAPNWEEMLRGSYGFHANHTGKLRTRDETRKYQDILKWFETIRGYIEERGGDLQDQELEDAINGRDALRRSLSGMM